MKKFLIVIGLLISTFIYSQNNNSLLWEVSGNGLQKNTYLYGTMHVSNKVSYHLSDDFFNALLNADIVANESDPETWSEANKLMQTKPAMYSSQLYKSFYIKPIEKNELLAIFKNKTHFFYNYLSLSQSENADFEENAVLDMFISQTGRKYNKEVASLEDALESMLPMMDLDTEDAEPAAENQQILYKLLKDKSFQEATVDYYREKNITILDSIYKLIFSKKGHEAMIVNRNIIMTDSIIKISKRGSLFAAVGAAHLAGKQGIINLLREKGYTVKPIIGELTEKGRKQKKDIEAYFKKPNFIPYTSSDKMIEGVLLKHEVLNTGVIGAPDFANGGLLKIIRKPHYYFIKKGTEFFNPKTLDSLFFENIPGEIESKKFVENKYVSYYDIKNKTKTGNFQHYRFYITPLEIILVSMSGLDNYTALFENEVYDKLQVNTPSEDWTKTSPENSSFSIEVPKFYALYGNDTEDKSQLDLQAFSSENNSYYFVSERVINDNTTLEDTEFEHKQIHYQFYLQHDIDSTGTKYNKIDNTFTSNSKKGNNRITLKTVISGNKYYMLGSVNATELQKEQFFDSFKENNKNNTISEYKTFTDSVANFSVSIPKKANESMFYKISKAKENKKNALLGNSKDYKIMSEDGSSIGISFQKSHAYRKIENIDSVKVFFQDYVLGKRNNINYATYESDEFYYDDEYDDYSSAGTTSMLSANMYSKNGLSRSTWYKMYEIDKNERELVSSSDKSDDNQYEYNAVVTTKKSSQAIKYKMVFNNNTMYILETLIPKNYSKNNQFIDDTFNTFKLIEPQTDKSIFNSKIDRFITDAKNENDTIRKNAFGDIYLLDFESNDFDKLTDFIENFEFKKSENKAKNDLISKLGDLDNVKVVPFLDKLYKADNSNSEIQLTVLTALAEKNTKESYEKILELLEYDLPISDSKYDISFLFNRISSNEENSKILFPKVLQFYSISEYQKPILNFCNTLLEKDLIRPTKIKSYKKMILTNAKLEYKRIKSWKINNTNDEEEEEKNEYSYYRKPPIDELVTFLNIIYKFPNDKDTKEFISKLDKLDIDELNIELLRLNFVSNTLSATKLKEALEDNKTKFIAINLLANKGSDNYKLENDEIALAAVHNFNLIKPKDEITFLDKQTVSRKGKKMMFYFYTISNEKDKSIKKTIKTIAFFLDDKKIIPNSFISLGSKKYDEDEDDVLKLMKAIINETIYSDHYRASFEKEKNNNSDYYDEYYDY